ncbi:5'/3'-nucleotidase SurE [Rubeoparvulum massiliense]|uniref:5'/3'-nucleotidase SurE n=1 Tax=Rubeoparvulum massiliense TaxID=1631346 RepID=UPI00065E4891|nr:5'/3'-nucleotidase SurE [Rubeoparvulum massiliense]
MRVLVTNDDGIQAPGIRVLVEALLQYQPTYELYVVAPANERSAVGHGITVRSPLHVEEYVLEGLPVKAWAVQGTPADCIKVGYHLLCEREVHLVISGINAGTNLGKDVYYSGTVSGAREGVILGVPGIALSYDNHFTPEDFSGVNQLLQSVFQQIEATVIPQGTLLNINLPNLKNHHVKGMIPAPLAWDFYEDRLQQIDDMKSGYWLEREYGRIHPLQDDYHLLMNGYITITPIQIDTADHSLLQQMNSWKIEFDGREGTEK